MQDLGNWNETLHLFNKSAFATRDPKCDPCSADSLDGPDILHPSKPGADLPALASLAPRTTLYLSLTPAHAENTVKGKITLQFLCVSLFSIRLMQTLNPCGYTQMPNF